MNEIWLLHKKALRILSKNLNRFIGYQLISSLILTLILLPLLKGIFSILMKSRGFDYIANGLVQKFLVSPQGAIMILISLLIGFMVVLMQLGGLIVLSYQTMLEQQDSRFFDILIYTLKRLKYMFGFDGIIIAIYFILVAPLLDNNLTAGIFSELKVPGFIMQAIESNTLYSVLLVVSVIIVAILAIRWMFALHVLLLDESVDRRFLRRSSKVLKKKLKYILKYTFYSVIINILATLLVLAVTIIAFSLLVLFLPMTVETKIIVVISIFFLALSALAAIGVPLSVVEMTILYKELTGIDKPLDIKVIQTTSRLNKLLSNKVFISLVVLAAIIGTSIYSVVMEESFMFVKYNVDVTAHRGSSFEAPENTMSAIKKAVENGADYVEIDVQLTKDNEIILLHDETFERTSQNLSRPDELTLSEIKILDAGLWFDKSFEGEEIATLQEVMTYARNKIKLNIEIKGSHYSPDIYNELIELIKLNNFKYDSVITSLNYEDLEAIETKAPYLKTGYIMFVALGDLEKLNVDFYSVEETNVNESFVEKAHEIGREVHVWTINEKDDMQKMLDFGVDNIITDQDKILKELLGEGKE